MYWRVQFPPGWLWNKHLYADLRITYLHTFATFTLHLQHLLAYICNIYLHTYATITCIHLQHLLAYICNIYLHTSATFMRIHLQHLCAYITYSYAQNILARSRNFDHLFYKQQNLQWRWKTFPMVFSVLSFSM